MTVGFDPDPDPVEIWNLVRRVYFTSHGQYKHNYGTYVPAFR